jgi:hypothetical protein
MLRLVLSAVFIVVMPIWSSAQETTAGSPKLTSPLQPLLEALDGANASGSVEFSEHCDGGTHWTFPPLRSPTNTGGSLLQVVREMFADDAAIQVNQNADGMIRIVENGARTDLLDIRISRVSFDSNGVPAGAFSPNTALRTILDTPEVVAFMEGHDMDLAVHPQGPLVNQPFLDGSRHLKESLNDVTLSHALDHVLKTFPGIWVYEECPSSDGKSQSVFLLFFSAKHPLLVEK